MHWLLANYESIQENDTLLKIIASLSPLDQQNFCIAASLVIWETKNSSITQRVFRVMFWRTNDQIILYFELGIRLCPFRPTETGLPANFNVGHLYPTFPSV